MSDDDPDVKRRDSAWMITVAFLVGVAIAASVVWTVWNDPKSGPAHAALVGSVFLVIGLTCGVLVAVVVRALVGVTERVIEWGRRRSGTRRRADPPGAGG